MKYLLSILFCLIVFIVKGQIAVNTNFAPAVAAPLDNRTVLTNLSDTSSISFRYEGMIIYITALDKFYFYTTKWDEFFADANTTVRGLVNTSAQSFAGNKTFTDGVVVDSLVNNVSLKVTGTVSTNWNIYTSSQTLDLRNNFIEIGQLTSEIDITLPGCTSISDGVEYYFIKTGTDNFPTGILTLGADTFTDGSLRKLIYGQGASVKCKCKFTGGVGRWYYLNN